MGCGCVVVVYCAGCQRVCCWTHHLPLHGRVALSVEQLQAARARLARRGTRLPACPPSAPTAVGGAAAGGVGG